MSRTGRTWLAALAGVLCLLVALTGCRGTATPAPTVTVTTTVTAQPSGSPSRTPTPTDTATNALVPDAPTTGLPTITVGELPAEAQRVLASIAAGASFPYRQDGQTFQNRERELPQQPAGFYREYTVPTPGSSDRGARRIVAGEDGARFYTDDHYRSFSEVVP